jgi:carboxymethylenebutenolidase
VKNILFVAFLLLLAACSSHNNVGNKTCCSVGEADDATTAFASFANDAAFQNAHPAPAPTEAFHQGQMVEFPVEGGVNGKAFLMKAHGNTNKYLFLFHEWWGLNDYIKRETANWCHTLGINVMAVDLYDGQIATTAEEAAKLMQANDAKRSAAIIAGAAKFVGDAADFRTMGWCFGGGWSHRAAIQLGDRAKACVIYYGMPEQDVAKLKGMACDAVFIHPEMDKWITAEMAAEFEKNMTAAGKKVAVHHYAADHAFANPSSPRYNDAAATAAREVVSKYLSGK